MSGILLDLPALNPTMRRGSHKEQESGRFITLESICPHPAAGSGCVKLGKY
jgi:hypothetical protein